MSKYICVAGTRQPVKSASGLTGPLGAWVRGDASKIIKTRRKNMKKIVINDILRQVDGIGVSKREYRKTTGLKSENNRDYSDKIHSFGSDKNFKRFLKELGRFAKDRGYQNSEMRLDKIRGNIFKEFAQDKIKTGGRNKKGITKRTVSNMFSQAEKLSIALKNLSEAKGAAFKFATPSELIKLKEELRPNAKDNVHFNRAIDNALSEKIVLSIKNEKAGIAAWLQLKGGLRESEAIKIKPWQMKGGTIADIHGKGGFHRDINIQKETYEKIIAYIENTGSFSITRKTYEKHLKEAFEANGVKYKGTHTLRYTYAQNSLIEKIETGMDSKEALRQVSKELGHHREDITLHYVR